MVGLSEMGEGCCARPMRLLPFSPDWQSEYSLAARIRRSQVLDAARNWDVTLYPSPPVGRGLPCRQPACAEGTTMLPDMRALPALDEPYWSEKPAAAETGQELAGDLGLTTSQLAIAWTLAARTRLRGRSRARRNARHLRDNFHGGAGGADA